MADIDDDDDSDGADDMSVLHSSARPGYALRYHSSSTARSTTRAQRAVGPPYGCFSVPKFQPMNALEAILALVFTNVFWVGLWDLLNNTVFPDDSTPAMLLLVGLGGVALYFTNSLYEPPNPRLAANAPRTPRAQQQRREERESRGHSVSPAEGGDPAGAEEGRGAGSAAGAGPGGGLEKPERSRSKSRTRQHMERIRSHPALAADPALDIQDYPFHPPRIEFWRLMERVLANCASVTIWVGVWDQIDINILPLVCSYEACGNCTAYGTFPCAYYKIVFTVVGLIGMWWTRQLYQDHEVTYVERGHLCASCCGSRSGAKDF